MYSNYLINSRFNQNQLGHKDRIAKYDNIKGLAIFLVVLVHVMSPARENGVDIYINLTNFLCIFAMPLLFFVGGYFSKIREDSSIKAFKNIFIPYIVFTAIWIVFNYYVLGNPLQKYPFVVPVYGLWFLASLFLMRLILPILVKIKHILLIAIITALLIGVLPLANDFFAYSRTFCFLPIFLVGYYYNDYKRELIGKISKYGSIVNLLKNKTFIFIIIVLSITLIGIFSISIGSFESSFDILQLGSSYVKTNLSIPEGIILRFIIIISGIIGALLVNKLMTNKVTFLTKLGINSFTIYILHLYIVRFIFVKLRQDSPLEFIFNDPLLNGVYTVIMVSLISYTLSRDYVTKIFNKFINIFTNAIMRPENQD